MKMEDGDGDTRNRANMVVGGDLSQGSTFAIFVLFDSPSVLCCVALRWFGLGWFCPFGLGQRKA